MKYVVDNLLIAWLLVIASSDLLADVVHVRDSVESRSTSTRTGTILDYTGVALHLRTISGRRTLIPAAQVVRVETKRNAAHTAGNRLLENRQYEQALAKFRDADKLEERDWVRREIYAQTAWCYRGLNQHASAGKVFLKILEHDAATLHFDCAPLVWIASEPAPPVAEEWIEDAGNPAARLLGASHLLNGIQQQRARSVLKNLTTDRDLRIALLAEAQLWRVSLAGNSAKELKQRAAIVKQIPEAVRGGPYFLLGKMLSQQQRSEQAVLAWMRLPVQYARQRELSSLALLHSGAELEKLGRKNQAMRLYRELARDYPNHQATSQAKRRLESFSQTNR